MSTQQREGVRPAAAEPSPPVPLTLVVSNPPSGDALEALAADYRNHSTAVYGLACRICGVARAADVTAAVFVHRGNHLGDFDRATGSLRAYLLTVTRDEALAVVGAGGFHESREAGTDPAENRLDPGSPRMTGALADLVPDERAAIETTFYGRCTYQDAAAVLGRPEGTVRSSIATGMRQLRAAICDRR